MVRTLLAHREPVVGLVLGNGHRSTVAVTEARGGRTVHSEVAPAENYNFVIERYYTQVDIMTHLCVHGLKLYQEKLEGPGVEQ